MNILTMMEKEQMRVDLPDFRPGDQIKVHVKIKEGEKERIQVFEGVVIRKRKGNTGATFTVRKVSYGVGVERIFPLHAPAIDRIDIVNRGKVRRSRLYYLRELKGKAARIKERRVIPGLKEAANPKI
ncbi:MAG: 50S ribosomal protein L19 [Pseudomonadota bacterium]